MKNNRYLVREFDSKYDLVANYDEDSLPITQFKANNAEPCFDFMSATSYDSESFQEKDFMFNEFESNQILLSDPKKFEALKMCMNA